MLPQTRFRPRADADHLSRLIQEAWAERQRVLTDQADALGVGETVAAHLEARFPLADMLVLRRHGVAKEISDVGVRTYSPESERWDEVVSVKLPRPVLTPGAHGVGEVSACGPRWSREPGRGLTEYGRSKYDDAEYAKFCADQDKGEASQLPESVEPFFSAVVAMRKAYKAEYRQASTWPAERKAATGEYPTWTEIAAQFPVLGAYMESQR